MATDIKMIFDIQLGLYSVSAGNSEAVALSRDHADSIAITHGKGTTSVVPQGQRNNCGFSR
jgi:hypothetical protein